jgi:putative peptidoglycan lipid II flippase
VSLWRNFASVSGFTLLSRATGFARDVTMSAFLGAGALADAFTIAFRLPNHFRAIFAEGAFNAAYVPAYARALTQGGPERARDFAAQMFTLLALAQVALLALALVFTQELLALLAPGVAQDPERYSHALTLTRIAFPYLLCVSLVTLLAGTLNAHGRFIAAAFAPVLLNLSIIACLAVAFLFPDAGVAAAVGVLLAGVLELALMIVAARRAGLFAWVARPGLGEDVRRFFKSFGPAVIGSAGVQIALFADTIIGSLLPAGGLSSIYYADRLYQLPVGVIGIAAGSVLLPEMSRRFASGDDAGALDAQNRTMALTIALCAPFFVAFVVTPDVIVRAAFERGAFDAQATAASAQVLAAYGYGLLAVVLIRSAVASFQGRGDTTTPMYVALGAVAVNVALKFALYEPLGAQGLALATAVGAWINFLALAFLATRAGVMRIDATTTRIVLAVTIASLALALVAAFGDRAFAQIGALVAPAFPAEAQLGVLGVAGALVYGASLAVLLPVFGVPLSRLRPARRSKPE